MIARIERGDSSPSWKTLERLLSRAGFELDSRLVPKRAGVTHMMGDVTRILDQSRWLLAKTWRV